MAIPTWRNVSAGNESGALSALANAGNQVSQGISNLGSFVTGLDEQNKADAANQFTQDLSSQIGNFGGDAQQLRDYATQQVRNNENLTPEQRTSAIENVLKEQESYAGLTAPQQEAVAAEQATVAAGLEDLSYQQQGQRQALQSEIGYPLERFNWQNDDSVSVEDVKKDYAYLKDSGLNVDNIRDVIAKKLGRQPTGKELQGLIVDASKTDFSPFNDNVIEVTEGLGSRLAGTALSTRVDEYLQSINSPAAAKRVRDLQAAQKAQSDSYTKASADKIKDFTSRARAGNVGVSRGQERQTINF